MSLLVIIYIFLGKAGFRNDCVSFIFFITFEGLREILVSHILTFCCHLLGGSELVSVSSSTSLGKLKKYH